MEPAKDLIVKLGQMLHYIWISKPRGVDCHFYIDALVYMMTAQRSTHNLLDSLKLQPPVKVPESVCLTAIDADMCHTLGDTFAQSLGAKERYLTDEEALAQRNRRFEFAATHKSPTRIPLLEAVNELFAAIATAETSEQCEAAVSEGFPPLGLAMHSHGGFTLLTATDVPDLDAATTVFLSKSKTSPKKAIFLKRHTKWL